MTKKVVAILAILMMSSLTMAAVTTTTVTVTASSSAGFSNGDVNAAVDSSYFAFLAGSSDGYTQRGLLKFPAIPAIQGMVIDSAVLHMNYCYAGGANAALPLTVSVYALQQDWDATTTWATQPALADISAAGTSLPVDSYGWYTWNIKAAVQAWANGLGNTSLQVRGDEGLVVVNPGWQVLKYIYQVGQAGNEPYLEITYREQPDLTLTATASGTIDNSDPDADINTTYYVLAGYSDGITHRSFLKFPSSSVLSGKVVDSATLYMNYSWTDGANSALPLTTRLFMLQSDWDSTTTWNTQPAVYAGSGDGGQVVATWLPAAASGWNTWDATEALQAWADGLGNTSLGIAGDEAFVVDNPAWQVVKFFNSANDAGYQPYIEIYYHEESLMSGDANGDGAVDVGDLGILAANYGATSGASWGQGDFNGDGAVDVGDLGILAAHYGEGSNDTISWADAYAQAFGTTADDETSDDSEATTSLACSSLGLSLIAGLAMMGLMMVKLEE
jgi:hypothetical protein